jgi:hypothetical protein
MRTKEESHQYYLLNREKISQRGKARYALNRERLLERRKSYQKTERGKLMAKVNSKRYRDRHKEEVRARVRAYSKSPKGREWRRLYLRNRMQNDPAFKLKWILRTRLRWLVRGKKCNKGHSAKMVGCSFDSLKKYLESQWQPGMSWENYGRTGWHIDHKRPCASFDLTKIEQQKACFHYSNLQPLWASENCVKGDKLFHGEPGCLPL